MPRLGLTADTIIETAAQMVNEIGIDKISIKLLAEKCNIKSPSFYNHFTNLDEIKNGVMLYGWKQLEEKALRAAVGVSGYAAVKAICYAFYDYATSNAGIFDAMLWYNNFQDEKAHKATQNMFDMIYKITASLNISEQNSAISCVCSAPFWKASVCSSIKSLSATRCPYRILLLFQSIP